jgi:hypothetical protein
MVPPRFAKVVESVKGADGKVPSTIPAALIAVANVWAFEFDVFKRDFTSVSTYEISATATSILRISTVTSNSTNV